MQALFLGGFRFSRKRFSARCFDGRCWLFGFFSVCCLLLSVGLSSAFAMSLSDAHPQIKLIDEEPAWVSPVPLAQNGHAASALGAASPAKGFHFTLLNLQHKVQARGVDYFVNVQKKITAVAGLSQANLEIEFDPEHETVLWQSLQLHRGNELIDVRHRTKARVIDREKSLEAAILFGRKTLFLIVPDVRVGDIIEYSYVLQERNPLWQKHFFLTRYLDWEHPVARYFLKVQWPEDRNIKWSVPSEFSYLKPQKKEAEWVFQYDSAIPPETVEATQDLASLAPVMKSMLPGPQEALGQYFGEGTTRSFQMSPLIEPLKAFSHDQSEIDQPVPGQRASGQEASPQEAAALASESAPDAPPATLPMVEFSEFQDWSGLAQWVQQIWAESDENIDSKQIYSLWQSLAQSQYQSPHADPEARLLEVVHWVQDQVRYFGLELGVGSLKPRSPELVLHSRFGDCKDKTLLLITLLKAMGLEASPVLVHSQAARLPYTLPTPAAFNHVIVEVPWQGMRLWIDATRAWQGGRLQDMHVADYERGLVLAEGEAGQWRDRPVFALRNETEVHTRVAVSTQPAEPSAMEVTTRYLGQSADVMRAQLQRHGQAWFAQGRLARYRTYYDALSVSAPLTVSDNRAENSLSVTEYYDIPNLWEANQVQSSRFYADGLYPLLRALEAQLELGEALVPPQRVRHQLEILLPDDGWQIPETSDVLSNAHFEFNYQSGLRGRAVFLGYELKPLQASFESFQQDHAAIAQDLGRIKNVLAFELMKTESTLASAPTVVAALSEESFPALGQLEDLLGQPLGNMLQGALAVLQHWSSALSHRTAEWQGYFQQREVLTRAEWGQFLHHYMSRLANDVTAQIGLLFGLTVWLCVRLLRRLRQAKQADGLYHPPASVFASLSLITFGLSALIWLVKNYGHKRGRARLRYWAGDRLGCFPFTSVMLSLLGIGTIVYVSQQFGIAWPMLGLGVVFFTLCPRVRELHRAGTGADLAPALGSVLSSQPQTTAEGADLKKPRVGSVAA